MLPSTYSQCHTCSRFFECTQLRKHESQCRKCNRCNALFSNPRRLIWHLKRCGANRGHDCTTPGNKLHGSHNRTHHQKRCISWPQRCDVSVRTNSQLTHHLTNCRNRPQTPQPSQPLPQQEVQSQPQSEQSLTASTQISANISTISTDQPSASEALISAYRSKAEPALLRADALVKSVIEQADPGSRAAIDHTRFLGYTQGMTIGETLTVDEALALDENDSLSTKIVVCSMADARRLFDVKPPLINVVVLGWDNSLGLSIDAFTSILLSRKSLDVHDYGLQMYTYSGKNMVPTGLQAKKKSSAEAIDLFRERHASNGLPINLLNFGKAKDNMVPPAIAGRVDYQAIELTRADNGKSSGVSHSDDLQDCAKFHVLATTGAAHLPHVDRHGVYTTILNEEGEKLWVIWPGLGIEGLKRWRQTDELPAPIGVYLEEGSILIQAPSTLHAPLTMHTCLMSGTMHWNTTQLLGILQATEAAIKDPGITNEGMAASFCQKMQVLLDLWNAGSATYSWPPESEYLECVRIIEWLKDGCNCGGTTQLCGTSRCSCAKSGRGCDDRCHVGRFGCKNL